MRYRRFGKTNVQVSEIGFGGAAISGSGAGYGFGTIPNQQAVSLLQWCLDCGVNLFDTAPIYGHGESEKRMGEAFRDRRDKAFIVSKCGIDWHQNKRINLDNRACTTRKMLNQSLRDLQTDYIDLYMVHYPDYRVDIRETMQVLVRAKELGKIRFIGLCNTNEREYSLAKQIGDIDVIQTELNIFEQTGFNAIKDLLNKDDLAHMSWGTLDKGIITGTVDRNRKFEAVDYRSRAIWRKKVNLEGRFQIMDQVESVLKQQKISGLDLALAHNLKIKENSIVLCGGRNQKQWKELLGHKAHQVGDGLLAMIKNKVSDIL